MKQKFNIDDEVRMQSATLYGETEGVVVEVDRMYKALCPFALKRGEEEFDEDFEEDEDD